MQKINSEVGLREAILRLEIKQIEDAKELNEKFHLASDSIKPINLVKSFFKKGTEPGEFKDDILNTSFGLMTGYLSKLLFQGITKSPVKKIVGTALMFGITSMIAKNPEAVRSVGNRILKIFRKKKRDK
jgi:hypothetical protein